jgi:hypothetical protein
MRFFWRIFVGVGMAFSVLSSCSETSQSPPLFRAVSPDESGIDFVNQIDENDTLNVIDYAYIYNGGGLGVGDLNNDGLQDLFFAGNMVNNRLYLNQGDFRFEDVSETAGIGINRWCTGVSLVDINTDGRLDIYLSVANKFSQEASRNLLYINQGNDAAGQPLFKEMAAAYGLDDAGYSTQAAFFDYDQDGDLDMYLLTNGMEGFNHNNTRPKKVNGEGISTDRLYRNEGPGTGEHPLFTDVSREANILKEGYGLGVTVNDFNMDGWPDIYAANDFITNDLMWINQGDGTFVDMAPEYLKHQTHNGMGTDVADYNNDGLVDIVVLDMLPEDNQRQKTMLSKMNYDKFLLNLNFDYTPQYVRNTLQLNNGFAPDGSLSFSEIGQLAGIYKTDWSWSALFADYDNDGLRDLLITNGYVKDVTDLDYIMYQSSASQFGSQETRDSKVKALADRLKSAKIHNYVYQNNGDLRFSDKSNEWGIAVPSFSNGTIFADLDNDGDLDLVMNNINDPAFVYENTTEKLGHHYLRLQLAGPQKNPAGQGSKITIWYHGEQQYHYHTTYRGYKSSLEEAIHFGLGQEAMVDSLLIVWPDGKSQMLQDIPADQRLILQYEEAGQRELPVNKKPEPLLKLTHQLDHLHRENDFVDFKYQSLIPRMYSRDGPALAVGDINGDGLDDVYIGGAKGHTGVFQIQQQGGDFIEKALSDAPDSEDMGSLFFDADQDGDLDLYVASGGNEYYEGHEAYRHRFYRNDGKGNFQRDTTAIPAILHSGSAVVAADYDQDGDLDLFVGGRLRPHHYPLPPRSYLLENEAGTFRDVTAEVAPELQNIGLVTAALWTDYDSDGRADLLLCGEWMPLTFMHNEGGKLVNQSAQTGLTNTEGWWNSLLAVDFDKDGDLDYVAGNLGLNTKYQASEKQPVSLYVKDFDLNNTIDPVISRYIMGEEFVDPPRDALIDQIVQMRRRFPRYDMYGDARFSDVFTEQDLEGAMVLKSKTMVSSYLENLGNGKFSIRELPLQAQFAPIYGMLAEDVNADGHTDLLTVGNSYASEAHGGWYDAGIGNVLLGNGQGGLLPAAMQESGFLVDTDAKAAATLLGHDQKAVYLFSSNSDSLKSFVLNRPMRDMMIIPLQSGDFYAEIALSNGKRYREEFHYGEGFLSQSGRNFCLPKALVEEVRIFNYEGESRTITPEEAALSLQK